MQRDRLGEVLLGSLPVVHADETCREHPHIAFRPPTAFMEVGDGLRDQCLQLLKAFGVKQSGHQVDAVLHRIGMMLHEWFQKRNHLGKAICFTQPCDQRVLLGFVQESVAVSDMQDFDRSRRHGKAIAKILSDSHRATSGGTPSR